MKSVIVNLTLLSLLVVVTNAWFLDLGKTTKSHKDSKLAAQATPNAGRKVILVAKKVYVPMYASDDTTSAVADRLLPISPAVMTMSETDGRQQQQQQPVVDYSSVAAMYMAPPPASYAMYAPAASAPVAADVPQYAVYPAGYGAGGEPQYVQFGVAPSQALMYGNGDAVAPATYYPIEVDKGTIAEGSVVPSEVTNA
ncbi:hypothetical protein DAPPUDRAFT_223706 [Daphnia pulex]|uniref:Uncharacterized protein n=1 Tax=Daphnia pulex TaxID=6669 RepID=E9GD04_DAPPU|nr:hypothetical protein DAPPUDRAFT_223706 [Daphnia pulex]|eukprot:EFX82648.1 hypothetical protein DAPPUDRAFT_223706 [Daphnia pulex]